MEFALGVVAGVVVLLAVLMLIGHRSNKKNAPARAASIQRREAVDKALAEARKGLAIGSSRTQHDLHGADFMRRVETKVAELLGEPKPEPILRRTSKGEVIQ